MEDFFHFLTTRLNLAQNKQWPGVHSQLPHAHSSFFNKSSVLKIAPGKPRAEHQQKVYATPEISSRASGVGRWNPYLQPLVTCNIRDKQEKEKGWQVSYDDWTWNFARNMVSGKLLFQWSKIFHQCGNFPKLPPQISAMEAIVPGAEHSDSVPTAPAWGQKLDARA